MMFIRIIQKLYKIHIVQSELDCMNNHQSTFLIQISYIDSCYFQNTILNDIIRFHFKNL